jgi:hypothetical protein
MSWSSACLYLFFEEDYSISLVILGSLLLDLGDFVVLFCD